MASDPILFYAAPSSLWNEEGHWNTGTPIRQSQLSAWLGQAMGPVAPPKAVVPEGDQISAPAQQADARMQADYAQYAQQLAALQGGQQQQPAGPSIWDFMGQGMANAPTRPSMSPYGQAPVSPYGQMASFNPYGTNAPGAGAMFGPTGSGQMGQP